MTIRELMDAQEREYQRSAKRWEAFYQRAVLELYDVINAEREAAAASKPTTTAAATTATAIITRRP